MNIFQPSWTQTWSDLGFTPPAHLFDELLAAYGEPQRHYHSQQHLAECLRHLDQARHWAVRPGEVAIALWFHDAIYDVQGHDNERHSADWALRVLQAAQADTATLQRVEALIMATRHDATPTDGDQQLLVDIDLSILGANPERFAEYDQQVRAEYNWVPSDTYAIKRKEVLASFLARPCIYNTRHFQERYEAQARANLAAVVSA